MAETDTHLPASPAESGRPSSWVSRHAGLITPPGRILDLAAGSGRHARYFKALGHDVLAIDRDISGLRDLAGQAGIEIREIDLENGQGWPLPGRRFAGIIVANYLHRPLLPHLSEALLPGGVLIYETFAVGNERFGRPSNPDFLLQPGELLAVARASGLTALAYEHGEIAVPRPAVIQRIAAQKPVRSSD